MRFAPVAPAPGAHHILRVHAGGGGAISPESINSPTGSKNVSIIRRGLTCFLFYASWPFC